MHDRHPGLSEPTGKHQAAAAAVCLARFHALPPTTLTVQAEATSRRFELVWIYPDARDLASNGNEDDATRDGAYAVALAAVEKRMQLVTVGRTATRTGADWHLRSRGTIEPVFDLDADDVHRLEVSGISDDDPPKMRARIRDKVAQTTRGTGTEPAIVAVVGFRSARVVLRKV